MSKEVTKFSFSYYGSTFIEEVPPEMMELIKSQFVDITSGNCRVPTILARRGISVGVNDRSYYSHIIAQALLTPSPAIDIKSYDPSVLELKPGLIASRSFSEAPILNDECASYVDTLLSPEQPAIIRAAMASTLCRTCTYRGAGFRVAVTGSGRSLTSLTAREMYESVSRAVIKANKYKAKIDFSKCQVAYGDAGEAPSKIKFTEDSVAYATPAWPFLGADGIDSYAFVLPCLLKQKIVKPLPFWTSDICMPIAATWIQNAFDNGAKYFVLVAQGENRPRGEDVRQFMSARFREHGCVITDKHIYCPANPFKAYWMIYTSSTTENKTLFLPTMENRLMSDSEEQTPKTKLSDVRRNLLVWCFDENDKDSFSKFVFGVSSSFQVGLLSVGDSGRELLPTIEVNQGYSAKRLIIVNKRDLDKATESCIASLKEQLESFDRIFLFILPTWYRVAIFTAVNRANLWDRVTAFEVSLASTARLLIESGDKLLSMPAGLIRGKTISVSKGAGQRYMETHSTYRRLPPFYQYLSTIPKEHQTTLTEEQEREFGSIKRTPKVNWGSFDEDDSE